MSGNHVEFGQRAEYHIDEGSGANIQVQLRAAELRIEKFLSELSARLPEFDLVHDAKTPKSEITTADPVVIIDLIYGRASADARLRVAGVTQRDVRNGGGYVSKVAGIPVVVSEVQEGLFEVILKVGEPL